MFPLHDSSPGVERRNMHYFPGPLFGIDFDIVVADETQKLKGAGSQPLSVAQRISSAHKICVSGTPLKTGKLDELQGLCAFLEIEPFTDIKR